MYENFLPDIKSLRKAEAKILAKNPDTALEVAVRSTVNMVRSRGYLHYGCFWFSVKKVLNAHSKSFYGNITDTSVTAIYRGETDLQTLIAAQDFMDFYNETYFQGARLFELASDKDGLPIKWQLFDEDMEIGEKDEDESW